MYVYTYDIRLGSIRKLPDVFTEKEEKGNARDIK